jgi:hypothetical protein
MLPAFVKRGLKHAVYPVYCGFMTAAIWLFRLVFRDGDDEGIDRLEREHHQWRKDLVIR